MKNFSLFYDTEEIDKVKSMLVNELGITDTCSVFVGENDLIDEIYKHCHTELYQFSYTYYSRLQNCLNIFDITENKYDLECENKIKEHCIIIALITIQYLLYKDKYITATRLESDGKLSGLNYLLSKYKFDKFNNLKFKHLKLDSRESYDRDKDAPEDEEDASADRNTINGIVQRYYEEKIKSKNLSYISKIVDVSVEKVNSGKKKYYNRRIPIIMSNLSYCVLTNQKKFKIEFLMNKINESKYYKSNSRIVDFIKRYDEFVNEINFDKARTTKVDKLLFKYFKERLFFTEYINYFSETENKIMSIINEPIRTSSYNYLNIEYKENKFPFLNNRLSSSEVIHGSEKKKYNLIDEIKTCMFLPNALSRLYFYKIWGEHEFNISDKGGIVYNMCNITIPLFENAFFIVLYEYLKQDTDENTILLKMNELLTNYVTNNIEVSLDDCKSDLQGVSVSKGYNNNRAINNYILELLNHAFFFVEPDNIHINHRYAFNGNDDFMDFYTRKVRNKVGEVDYNNSKKFSIADDYNRFINERVDGGFTYIRKLRE